MYYYSVLFTVSLLFVLHYIILYYTILYYILYYILYIIYYILYIIYCIYIYIYALSFLTTILLQTSPVRLVKIGRRTQKSHGVGFDQSLVLAQGIVGTALNPMPGHSTSHTFPSILQQFMLFIPECLRVYTKHNFSAICPLVKLHIMFLGKMNTGAHVVWICLKCPLAASKSFARCISSYPLLAACWLCLNCHCCSHNNCRIDTKKNWNCRAVHRLKFLKLFETWT